MVWVYIFVDKQTCKCCTVSYSRERKIKMLSTEQILPAEEIYRFVLCNG